MALFIGLILAFVSGFALIEMGFTEPAASLASRIFAIACGLILTAPGFILLYAMIKEWKPSKTKAGLKGYLDQLKYIRRKRQTEMVTDRNPLEAKIRKYNKDYNTFFGESGIPVNSELQSDMTQIGWHMTALHKQRLNDKGIVMEQKHERTHYDGVPTFTHTDLFDGKYQIKEIKETARSVRTFVKDHKKIAELVNNQLATYRVISAHQKGKNEVVCPTCGNVTNRDDLIDGCDYCGTKFTVEDLGERISDRGYMKSADIENSRLQAFMVKAVTFFVVLLVIALFCFAFFGMLYANTTIEAGFFTRIAVTVLGTVFVVFSFGFLGWFFFMFGILPFLAPLGMLVLAGGAHLKSRKEIAEMRKAASRNLMIEQKVRKNDPLFSIVGFYANVENKLALLHYARNALQAAAFAEGEACEIEMERRREKYSDVINMDVETIELKDYRIEQKMQVATVEADINLMSEKDGRVKKSSEHVRVKLIKSASCKTQSVCDVAMIKCTQCGASISVLEGKKCWYCGHVRDLKENDWVILEYKA